MAWKNPLTFLVGSRALWPALRLFRALFKKREFTRVPLTIEAKVVPSSGGASLSGQITDLSMKGLYFLCDQSLPIGAECQVTLLTKERHLTSLPASVPIKARGKITRVTQSGMGVEFMEIEGKESFDSLRGVLLSHATKAEQIEGEIHTASWSYTTQVTYPAASRHPRPIKKNVIRRTARP